MTTSNDHDALFRTATLELRVLLSIPWKAATHALERRLLEHNQDITRLQYGVLRILVHEGQHTLSELSRKFSLDPSTLVPTVDALARKGLVKRERDPKDRRRFPLSITPEGNELVTGLATLDANDPVLQGLQALGVERTQELLNILCELVHNMPGGEQLLADATPRLIAYGADKGHLICKQLQAPKAETNAAAEAEAEAAE